MTDPNSITPESGCAGMNCKAPTEEHSPECHAQHAAAAAGGVFVKLGIDWAALASSAPVAHRTRYRSEPGMIGHYPWAYRDGFPWPPTIRPQFETETLYNFEQFRSHAASAAGYLLAASGQWLTNDATHKAFGEAERAAGRLEAEAPIRAAVTAYYTALDARQHGGVAQSFTFSAIERALGMSWSAHQAASKEGANG